MEKTEGGQAVSHIVNANKMVVSRTPRTDRQVRLWSDLNQQWVKIGFARQLERQLAGANKRIVELEKENERIARMESFINRFLDPEDLGYVVNNYVRDDAREALGRERVESKP